MQWHAITGTTTCNLLRCRILTGDKARDIVFIHRITLHCEEVYPFTFRRRQFPIKLPFARVRSWQSLHIFLGEQRRNEMIKNYVAKVRLFCDLYLFLNHKFVGDRQDRTNTIEADY